MPGIATYCKYGRFEGQPLKKKKKCPKNFVKMIKLLLRYKLHILASDGKWEDYTVVMVNVVNKNDEAPVFTVNEYYGSVTEELDGSPVFVLQVKTSLSC